MTIIMNQITFITNDNVSFTEDKNVLKQSKFFNEIMEIDNDDPINIKVSSGTMLLILQFMNRQLQNPTELSKPIKIPYSDKMEKNVPEWYVAYTNDFFRTTETTASVIELLNAADYLQLERLVNLITCKISSVLKEKLKSGEGYKHCLDMFQLKPLSDTNKEEIWSENPWITE